MNSFSDDVFTAQTGRATVEGTEIAGAETVTLNATRKQFDEALLKVLEKAKTDTRVTDFLIGLGISDKKDTTYQDAITELKDGISEDINNCSDNDKITITVISEKNVLRSIVLTGNNNDNKYSVSFTTTLKDGTHYVKGVVMCNEKKAVDLSYQQKPNDKGSADGELLINVDPKAFVIDESDESGDTVSEEYQSYIEIGSYSLSIKFSGEKKDNKVSVNTKLEISTEQSGLKITATVNIAFQYEKVSDTENKFSLNISTNVMDTVVDLTFSGGRKIVDYTAIKIPADSEVDDISKFNSDDLTKKLIEKYPGIEKYNPDFNSASQSTEYEETGLEVYKTEDGSFS
jgi:hypothetical protein